MSNKIEGMTENTLDKIREIANADTIIGKSIVSDDGTVIIPVSKVSYGFAAGGSDFSSEKNVNKDMMFGGGSGAGISIVPVAFLVIANGDVKLLQVESFSGAIDRVISMAPDIVDKIGKLIDKHKSKKEDKNKENQ